jgi:hypothetical protein
MYKRLKYKPEGRRNLRKILTEGHRSVTEVWSWNWSNQSFAALVTVKNLTAEG